MATGDPAKITLRLISVGGLALLVEHDGVQVADYQFDGGFGDDDSRVLKGAETTLRALGYVPDIWRMYMDMSLMVLHLYRDRPAVRRCMRCGKKDSEHAVSCGAEWVDSVDLTAGEES